MNFSTRLKQRVFMATVMVVAVTSHLLKAQPEANTVERVFTFAVKSSSDLLNGTEGSIRLVYADAAKTKLIGIDYCHNHWDMYPDLTAKSWDCAATIPLDKIKNGVKVISIPKIGTALEIKAPDLTATQGGRVDIILGKKLRAVGSNSYRKVQIDLVRAVGGGLVASYSGSTFNKVNLEGWATVVLLKGGLDSIEFLSGTKSIYKADVDQLLAP